MAQQDLLLPWLSVRENATLGARLRGWSPTNGLRKPTNCSPALPTAATPCRLLARRDASTRRPGANADGKPSHHPDDEPFALDAITRLQLQDIAADLLADRTVLLVTHDPLEALRLGYRIHVMSGRPARLGDAIAPVGPAPRRVTDPRLVNQMSCSRS